MLGTSTPRLSWRVAAGPRDWLQAAYELKLERATSGPLESGLVPSADSVFVPWPFDPLSSRERVTVSVRVHGDDGSLSAWSDPASVEIGLLAPADWRGRFIGPAIDDDFRGALHLRRTFRAEDEVVSARLYVSALGIFEPYLNGEAPGLAGEPAALARSRPRPRAPWARGRGRRDFSTLGDRHRDRLLTSISIYCHRRPSHVLPAVPGLSVSGCHPSANVDAKCMNR